MAKKSPLGEGVRPFDPSTFWSPVVGSECGSECVAVGSGERLALGANVWLLGAERDCRWERMRGCWERRETVVGSGCVAVGSGERLSLGADAWLLGARPARWERVAWRVGTETGVLGAGCVACWDRDRRAGSECVAVGSGERLSMGADAWLLGAERACRWERMRGCWERREARPVLFRLPARSRNSAVTDRPYTGTKGPKSGPFAEQKSDNAQIPHNVHNPN